MIAWALMVPLMRNLQIVQVQNCAERNGRSLKYMIIRFEIFFVDQCFVNFVQAKFKHSQMRTHATELDQIALHSQTL